jgi:hypothetical protein
MTIKIKFLKDNGVELQAIGIVYGHEIIKANTKIINYKDFRKLKYQIVDKFACTEYAVSVDDIKELAKLDTIISQMNPNIIIAIIESESLQFSLTKLWQAFVEESKLKNASFKCRQEAMEWVKANIQH